MASQQVQALRRRREISVDLGGGLTVTCLRPREGDMAGMFEGEGATRSLSIRLEHVQKFVTGWSGFSEATFFGASVGSSDPLPFDAELWAEAVGDHVEWVNAVANKMLAAIVTHFEEKAASEKN